MFIKIDIREPDLLQQINHLTSTIPIFKNLTIKSETLPIGDIIISYNDTELIIIERKSLQDLASSIKDGRYNEQSFRLNAHNVHNHNIIYLIEGDWNHYNHSKFNKSINQHTLMSSIISINYYKGFSVYRTLNISETALYIVYLADKLQRENNKKKPFYNNGNDNGDRCDNINNENIIHNTQDMDLELAISEIKDNHSDKTEHYSQVVKKVKKDNITINNIGEILLSQIPNVSTQSAIAIMNKFKTIKNLIHHLEKDEKCLDDIFTGSETNKHRKLNKNCKMSVYKYLLQRDNEVIIE